MDDSTGSKLQVRKALRPLRLCGLCVFHELSPVRTIQG
jgi:hypothetical protein